MNTTKLLSGREVLADSNGNAVEFTTKRLATKEAALKGGHVWKSTNGRIYFICPGPQPQPKYTSAPTRLRGLK